ncbi:hypothetical protein GIB67_029142, partial [Kingdonia uniflora]
MVNLVRGDVIALQAEKFTTNHIEKEVFKHCFEEFEEESLRNNFMAVYELLEEMMDFGYPQYIKAKILYKIFKTDAYRMEVIQRPSMAVTNTVSWRSEGIRYIKNEVFLDGITQEVAITELTKSSDSEEDSKELVSLPKSSAINGNGEGELPNNSSMASTPTKPEIKFEKWIFHAAQLVFILEAYALYDPVTRHEAFWWFLPVSMEKNDITSDLTKRGSLHSLRLNRRSLNLKTHTSISISKSFKLIIASSYAECPRLRS